MQRSSNQSFIQKFPDSDRGEAKGRATFLGGEQDEEKETNAHSFTSLTMQTLSPTKGDKSPFSKTPWEKVGKSNGGDDESDKQAKVNSSGGTGKQGFRISGLGKLLLSKARNKQ